MEYAVLVVDVDGTLLGAERKWVTDECVHTLRAVQQRGIPVVVASGRAPLATSPAVLNGFAADYRVCNNGACILDKSEMPVYENRLDLIQVEALIRFCEAGDYRLCFSFEDGYYVYVNYEQYIEYYKATAGDTGGIIDGQSRTRHLKSLPYGAFGIMPPDAVSRFTAAHPDMKMMESTKGSYDICRVTTGKKSALDSLFSTLSVTWERAVIIGDGINDLDMVAAAGLGIAMGNAVDEVKAAAAHVTDSMLEDGVVSAVRKFILT